MFLSLDPGTFVIQLVNFAIFFAVLDRLFLRPVGKALRERREHIDAVQADFETYSAQAGTLRSDAEAKRAAARREADEAISKARSVADAQAAKIVADRTEEAQKIADRARDTVAGEVAAARERENELATSLAKSLLDRALGAGK